MTLMPPLKPGDPVPSPCVNTCVMTQATPTAPALCKGCARSIDEIAAWSVMDDAQKLAVWAELEARRSSLAWLKARYKT